jgi:hypothetical protein
MKIVYGIFTLGSWIFEKYRLVVWTYRVLYQGVSVVIWVQEKIIWYLGGTITAYWFMTWLLC